MAAGVSARRAAAACLFDEDALDPTSSLGHALLSAEHAAVSSATVDTEYRSAVT